MPSLGEVLNDPAARKEAGDKAKGLSKEHLAELVKVQKNESESATAELRKKWRVWWRMWQNEITYQGKEEWQTKLWVPKIFTATEQATALIQRSILDSDSPFGMTGNNDESRAMADKLWNPLLKQTLTKADIAYKFADACKVGFITGVAGYLKLRPTFVNVPKLMSATLDPTTGVILPSFTQKKKTFLQIDFVEPWNIYRDPESRPRQNFSGTYLYHCEWKDRNALKAMVGNGWDKQALDKVLATDYSKTFTDTSYGMTDSQRVADERKQYHYYERHKFRHTYLVDEGWLDILDENGDVVLPNALMVHSNGEILYGPVDNPIWATDGNTGRRKTPFVAGTPLTHPTRFEGRGIVEQDASLSQLYSNVFMLWADGLNWLINPPTEVHQDALIDWEDLEHYPGKLWVKRTEGPALTPAQMGQMDTNAVMGSLEYIDRIRQNSNFVTDFAIGLPGSRSDITKGETQIKTAQSLAIFESMGRNLELMGKDVVGLAYDLLTQYFNDYTDPAIVKMVGPEAAAMLSSVPLEKRIDMLQGDYDFNFAGVTQALMKSEQLAKVMQFATLAATPQYAGLVSPVNVLQVIGDLLGVTDRIQIATAPPPPPPPPPPDEPKVSISLRGDLSPADVTKFANENEGMEPEHGGPGLPGAPPAGPGGPAGRPLAVHGPLGPIHVPPKGAQPQPLNVPAGPLAQG